MPPTSPTDAVQSSKKETWGREVAAVVLVGAILLLAVAHLSSLASLPYNAWNNARLAPSLALAYGHPLYSGADNGPIEPTLYGPVKALLLLPAALAETPTGALMIAGSINLAVLLLPLLILLWSGAGSARPSPRNLVVGFVFAASFSLLVPSLRYMATNIHVDAPAVGLGLLSCVVLMSSGDAPRLRRLMLAAVLVVLAAWSKQIEAPLAIAQFAWLWMAFGRRSAVRFAYCLAAAGVAVSGLFFSTFGFSEMVFNIFTLVAVHPLDGGWEWILLAGIDFLINSSFFLLIILLALRSFSLQTSTRGVSGFVGSSLKDLPWSLLLFAAVLLAPPSILARSFLGGDQNSFHAHYYLLAAAALILTQAISGEERSESLSARGRATIALVAVLAVLAVIATYKENPPSRIPDLFNNPLEQAWHFAREHPGEVYLPWHPLVTLMTDGELYHFDYAIYDHELAGHEITRERFLAHVPEALAYVVVPEMVFTSTFRRFLPEFSERVDVTDLEGWAVLTRRTGTVRE